METFRADHLIPLNFHLELLYPPRELQQQMLLELFNEMCGTYGFQSFNLIPEGKGAVFFTGKESRCEILKDKTIVREEGGAISFESFSENVMGMMSTVTQRLQPPVFVGQQNVLRMLYPLSNRQTASGFLMETFLRMPDGLVSQLGRPLAGIGLRLVFPPTSDSPSEYQLRIEPYFRDQTQLYLELVGRFLPPFKELEESSVRLRATYDFLKSAVGSLL